MMRALIILLILTGMTFDAAAQKRKKPVRKKPAKKTTTLQRGASKDTTLKGATIEIIQSYKPEVKDAPKPEFPTSLPPVDTTTPELTYDVPQQSLSYTYSSFPLKPLALGTDTVNIPFANYVKLGGGNQSTLMLNAGIGSVRGQNYETNFQLSHLSQAGSIANQKSSLTELQANGTLHTNDHAWHAGVEALRNQYHLYGYDHDVYSYSSAAVKQAYTGIRLKLDMKNEEEGFYGLNYHPSFHVSSYGTNNNTTERTIGFNVPVSYEIDTTLSLEMGINALLTQFNGSIGPGQGNNIFQLTPGVKFNTEIFKGHAGLYPTFGKGNAYILPDIEAAFHIRNTQFAFHAGYQALLRQNTYEQLTLRNPYITDSLTIKQTRSDELFAGIKSNIGNHISFSGRVSWWQYRNLPLFVNDTAFDEKQFNVVYDEKVNAISLQASIRYQIAHTFALGFSGTWYNFYNKTFDKVWHEPAVRFTGDLLVKPIRNLTVTGYLSIMDEIYAITKNNSTDRLDAIIDIGGSAEYNFIPRLSAFLTVNNLLNNRYERWRNYEVYGFNIIGGVRLKF